MNYRFSVRLVVLALLTLLVATTSFAQSGDPRILVLIPEEVIRRPVPDPAAETEVMRALIADGFRVLDVAQSERLEAREIVKNFAEVTPEQLLDLATRFNADLLVTGEAFSEEVPTPPGRDLRGLQLYQARLEVKVVDLANAQVIFSDAFVETGLMLGEAVAAKAALQNAGVSAGKQLPEQINNWVNGTGKVAARAYTVKITNLPSFTVYRQIMTALEGYVGVSGVESRQFDKAGSDIEVQYSGSPEDLAIILETQLNVEITGLSAGEVRGEYK